MPYFIGLILTLIAGSFIGWTIGANDAANCVGADIGSRRMTLKQGIIITCVFSFLGAITLGSRVIKTVGKGIVPLDKVDPNVALFIALAACFGAGIWVLLATYFKLPVSTSHSMVGAVAGAGLAVGTPVVWRKLLDIFICWLATPIGAALIAGLLYRPVRRIFYMLVPRRFETPVTTFLLFITSMYLAFIWGSNDVANVTGVMAGAGFFSTNMATMIGSLAIIVGIVTLGYRVIHTVGFSITRLLPLMGVVAEVASAININVYTLLGIPVSTSHSIVGAVFGVGFARGKKTIDKKIARDIILAWSVTPFASGFICFTMIKLIAMSNLL